MKTQIRFGNLINIFLSSAKSFLLMFLLFSYGVGMAQDKTLYIGVSLSSMVSGSGLGACLSPQLIIHNERHSLAAGVNVENPHYNFSGFRGRYEFSFIPNGATQIFLFYDFALRKKVFLSKHTVTYEDMITPTSEMYFNNVRLTAIEQHIGFGMSVHVFRSLQMFGAFGIGYYNTLDCNQNNQFQYREDKDFSILLTIGIKVDLKKIK